MPRITSQDELNRLVELISAHQDGIGIDGLLRALGGSLQRRSLRYDQKSATASAG